MEYDIEKFNHLIKNRRSIYPNMYTGEQVPDQVIEQMLENANWAPNHRLTEPWRFVVFKGTGLKKLADFQAELYRQISLSNDEFKQDNYDKLASKPLSASHIIAIGMHRDEKNRLPEIEEIEAVACAVQNMALTAEVYRVGCYWGSGGITYYDEAKEFFGLGANDKLLGFLYVGVPKIRPPRGRRKPIDQKVKWVVE
ncbi:MAG: nitroreductase family protein [Cyclobacteriaceae bacterium]